MQGKKRKQTKQAGETFENMQINGQVEHHRVQHAYAMFFIN